MTQVARGTAPGPSVPGERPRPVLLAAARVAGEAALLGLVSVTLLVVLGWIADGRSGSGAAAALRTSGQVWLLAHHGALTLAGPPPGTLGLLPLGLVPLPALLLVRAGGNLGRALRPGSRAEAVLATASLASWYALLAALLTGLVATPSVRPDPVQALLGAWSLAMLAGGAGVVRACGWAGWLRRRLPPRVRAVAAAVAVALGVLLAAGAGLAGASLAVHGGEAAALSRQLGAGKVGGLVLLVAGVALLPNAAIWSAAYLAGPGFAAGAGSAVSPFGVALGGLPALPLLAALPAPGPGPLQALPALVLPWCGGVLAGRVLARRLPVRESEGPAASGGGQGAAAAAGATTGLLTGAIFALLAAIAGGPAGPGRLATAGPSPWRTGVAVALEVAVPATLVAAATVHRRNRPAATTRP